MRVLKKYANRRLYDTKTSSYIKLEDVQQLVVQFQPIQVIDIATDEDITEHILLSVISNIENRKTHQKVLTRTLLEQLIRMYSYDYTASSPLSQYLENALKFYEDGIGKMSQPLGMWSSMLSGPYEMWHKAFSNALMPNRVREQENPQSDEGASESDKSAKAPSSTNRKGVAHTARKKKGASVARKQAATKTAARPTAKKTAQARPVSVQPK